MESERFGDTRGNHPSLCDCQRTDKAETQHGACFSVHTSNTKGDYASTKSESHNAYSENHALPHDETRKRLKSNIHTPIGI